MSQKLEYLRKACRQSAIFGNLEQISYKTHSFFKYLTATLQNSSVLEKNLSFLALRLNEPVVTNHTINALKKPRLQPGKLY